MRTSGPSVNPLGLGATNLKTLDAAARRWPSAQLLAQPISLAVGGAKCRHCRQSAEPLFTFLRIASRFTPFARAPYSVETVCCHVANRLVRVGAARVGHMVGCLANSRYATMNRCRVAERRDYDKLRGAGLTLTRRSGHWRLLRQTDGCAGYSACDQSRRTPRIGSSRHR